MNQQPQPTSADGIVISAKQLKELRDFLAEQPFKVAQPLLTFFAQLESESMKAAQENEPKTVQESEPVAQSDNKKLKKA